MGIFPGSMILSAKTLSNVFNLIMYFPLFPQIWLNWYVSKLRMKLMAFCSICEFWEKGLLNLLCCEYAVIW